ncbi:hypothetical protein VTI28DRAFT_671 [Corynascus sepedonium]
MQHAQDSTQDFTPSGDASNAPDKGSDSTSPGGPRSPQLSPSLETVMQPGATSAELPANVKERVKESYDAIATAYNQWTLLHQARRMHYTTRLLEFIQADRRNTLETDKKGKIDDNNDGGDLVSLKGMHALEVGCGTGVPVLEILLSKEMDTIGVDISASQIALARANFPHQTATLQAVWAERDMMDLRYPPANFDVVIGLYSLNHLPREEQTLFLHRAHRWLKPGGMLMVNFPQQELQSEVAEHWLEQDKGWMFWSSWGEEKTMQVIEGLEGMEVLLKEVTEAGEGDPAFVWVIARKNRVVKSAENSAE